MKVVTVYSSSHEPLLNEWFLPSLPAGFELETHRCDAVHGGGYLEPEWSRVIVHKADVVIDAIRRFRGEYFVYSDVDVQFFGATPEDLLAAVGDADGAFQNDSPRQARCGR